MSFLKNRLVSVPIKFGVFGAVFAIGLFLMFYFLDKNPLVNIKLADLLILAVFIFFGLKEYRDKYNNRQMHFWQGMTGGFINYMTIACISAVFIYIMTAIIDPELTSRYVTGQLALLHENHQTLVQTMDEEAYQQAVNGVKDTTSLDLALDDFLKKTIVGLFVTIIISVILRK